MPMIYVLRCRHCEMAPLLCNIFKFMQLSMKTVDRSYDRVEFIFLL